MQLEQSVLDSCQLVVQAPLLPFPHTPTSHPRILTPPVLDSPHVELEQVHQLAVQVRLLALVAVQAAHANLDQYRPVLQQRVHEATRRQL